MNVNIIEKANQIVNQESDAYMALIDENGFPSVSTLSSIRTKGIYQAYYSTGISGNKAKRILKNNKASVCYRKGDDNVTLVGYAEVLTDKKTKKDLWQDWFINHFPGGIDDPEYCIISFITQRVSLWIDSESAEFNISDVMNVQSHCGLLCHSCDYKESHNCGGCIETKGNPFHGVCPIAACCQKKQLAHCGECDTMPCDQLYEYSCLDKDHGDQPAGARLSILRCWAE